ncbi:reverse transcriptase domain-containing protein [Tanacetum coccineum]
MRTRNYRFPNNSPVTILRRRNRGRAPNIVEPELRTIVEVVPMAETRTMEELLRAPTEGYGEAIVIPEINADHFEIKTNLLQLVQASPFHGFERENPHSHISNFKRITSTLRFRGVPNDVIKLMMFPYSLEGAARIWYEKEPPNSILTWDDLVTKFVNQFFPPSKTTHLKNEISRFTQKFEETFSEAWERFKEMLRACPHHGFSELTQIDTFYNGLNDNDQDSLNAAAGGNLLSKTTRDALNIIENKSKVRYSRNKPNASRLSSTSRENASKTDEQIDKLADQLSTLVEIVSKKVVTPALVKAVEESCVTCGGAHSWYNCPNTDSNQASVCATTGTYNQVAPPNRASNQMAPPGFAPNQASPLGTLSSNTIPNLKGDMKAITTRSGVAYEGPLIPTNSSPKKVVERDTEETTVKEQSNFQGSTTQIPPSANVPYPSRHNPERFREKASYQKEKIFQMFQDLRFDISIVDALFLMPRFTPTIRNLLMNKEKLLEFAKIPLNENCSKLNFPNLCLISCLLNAATGGNLLSKTTRDALIIIENKSKVRYSRNKPNASRLSSTSRENASKTDEQIDKLADQLSTLVEIVSKKVVTPALVKAVEESCVTCGGAHSWYNCPNTDSNQASVCATTGTYNQVAPPNRASNQMAPPGFAPVQNGQNKFNQNQIQGNNFNRGNNFYANQGFQAHNNHAPNFQNQGFQNQPFQGHNNQVQQGVQNEFSNYMKSNDQVMRNMQSQINSLKGDFKNEIQNTMKTQQAFLMNQQNVFQNNLQNMLSGFFQNQASTSGTLPSNTIPNLKGEMKAITTRSGVAYEGPSIPTNSPPKKEPVPKPTTIPEPDVPKNLPKANVPYPSRLNQERFREKASYQKEKIFQMFQDLRFDISFADALFLMPRFTPTIRNLLMNKEKLLEFAKIPLNENCSAILLKKLPEKLRDPDKFLIPCNFPGMDMTLELADRSITPPKGLAEDIYVKVGKFHFPTDFVVVDFKADPRVPLILGRSFLRTGRALIDVYGEEITLRVDNEAVTFNLDQTTRYSYTNDKLVNRIDIIDVVCEEYAPKLLGFNDSSGGNPTPTSEPFTSEFILEEIESYLKDDSISPEIDHANCNPEEDICLIKKLLNNDPFQLPPMNLKQSEVTNAKSTIEEPLELELKDLPSHLEYAYLEENDKLPIIIAKRFKR